MKVPCSSNKPVWMRRTCSWKSMLQGWLQCESMLVGGDVNFIFSSSLLLICLYSMNNWWFADFLDLECSVKREGNALYSAFKVFVAVYHRLLFSLCLFQTFSMEIFSFHASSAMNLTWCSTSARFTRSLFFAIAGRLLGLELNG